MELLNAKFCSDDGGHWEIQSEHQYDDIENLDELEDVGRGKELRDELLKRNLTCESFLQRMDMIMAADCEWEFAASPEVTK